MTDRERERARRVGLNEALFREVNERLSELAEGTAHPSEPLDLICECGNASCDRRIQLDRSAYEQLRSDPLRFAVVNGHELPEVEEVVDRLGGYNVVRKQGEEAERVARQTDPRAST
jgi:hypothetical protein